MCVIPLVLVVVVLLSASSGAQGQAGLMFKGVEVPEHSQVVREETGTDNADTLMCVSNYSPCCFDYENRWRFVGGGSASVTPGDVFYQSNGDGVVRLHNGGSAGGEGIFRCDIRVADGASGIQTLLVGIYPSVSDGYGGDGTVTVDCTGGTFTLTSGPEADPPEFTLSGCTSSGGAVREFSCVSPGGDVSGTITGANSFTNTATNRRQGNYDFSVRVNGNYPGDYRCQATVYRYDGTGDEPEVINYSVAETITVPATDPPTGLAAPQAGTTMRVYWTPPSPTPYGYRIYYQPKGGAQQSNVVGGSTTSRDLTVQEDVVYTVSIQTLSNTELPSESSYTVQSRTAPLVRIGDVVIPNHGIVNRDEIGEDPENRLECLTNNLDCCAQSDDFGVHWFYPDGDVVQYSSSSAPYYRIRGGLGFGAYLHRDGGTEQGIFRCQIPDRNGVLISYYVGAYADGEGAVSIRELVFTVLSEDPPSFLLSCITEGGPASTVMWTRNGMPVTEDSNHVILQSVVNGVTAEYNNSLIMSVAEYGTYRCTIDNDRTDPPVSQDIQAADMSVILTSTGSTTAGSTDYSITCMVTAFGLTGTPSITWMDPHGTIISTDTDFTVGAVTGSGPTYSSVLMFNSLKASLVGEYTCSAALDSEADEAVVSVNATIPPPSVHVTADQDRTIYNGETITLTCDITLDPAVDSEVAVTVSWTAPGGAVITAGVLGMTNTEPYQSTLTLSSLMTSHTGDYTCIARVDPVSTFVTGISDYADSYSLTVENYTASISAMGVATTSETYSLTCTVKGVTDTPTIQWFGPDGNERMSTTALTSTLTLSDLSLSDAGQYTCRSTLSGVVREALNHLLVQNEANFQLLLGPVTPCTTWTDEKTKEIEMAVSAAITDILSARCKFSMSDLQSSVFSCWTSPSEVTYRNTIVSTDNTSQLVGYIKDWVNLEQQFCLLVNSV